MTSAADPTRPSSRARHRRPKFLVQSAGLLLTVAAGLYVLFAPSYQTEVSTSSGGSSSDATTMLDYLGPMSLVLVLIPIVVAAAPLLVPPQFWQPASVLAAALMSVWTLAGAWTVGAFYVPALVALVAAIFLSPRRRVQ